MSNIILPQVDILPELKKEATVLIEQDGRIHRFASSALEIDINIYEINITDNFMSIEDLAKKLSELYPNAKIDKGDLMIVTNPLGVKSVYQYGDSWIACNGLVDAAAVVMPSDIKLAGNYTRVGNLTKKENETITFPAEGRTIKEIFDDIFCKREQPTIVEPDIIFTPKTITSVERGTEVSPKFTLTFVPGSYSYNDTNVIPLNIKVEEIVVKDNVCVVVREQELTWEEAKKKWPHPDKNKLNIQLDKWVLDKTNDNYEICFTIHHSEGNIALDNLGDNSINEMRIEEMLLSMLSTRIFTIYNPWFIYIGDKIETINENLLKSKNATVKKDLKDQLITINAGTKMVVFATPKSSSKKLTKVINTSGLNEDLIAEKRMTQSEILISDKRGNDPEPYIVWSMTSEKELEQAILQLYFS